MKIHAGLLNPILIEEKFLEEGETCTVEVTSDFVGKLLLSVTNGDSGKVFAVNGDVDISEFAEKAGKIEMEVLYEVDGVIAKKWTVEPIIVRQTEPTYDAIPAIEELKEELADVKEAIIELYKIIKGE